MIWVKVVGEVITYYNDMTYVISYLKVVCNKITESIHDFGKLFYFFI
jgi:hypothetical protein